MIVKHICKQPQLNSTHTNFYECEGTKLISPNGENNFQVDLIALNDEVKKSITIFPEDLEHNEIYVINSLGKTINRII